MLSFIVNFFKSLNSNSRPEQIANSFCIGLILGFMPKNNLLWFIVFVFFAFVRINKCGYGIMILLGSMLQSLLLHLWKIFMHSFWIFLWSDLQNLIIRFFLVLLYADF